MFKNFLLFIALCISTNVVAEPFASEVKVGVFIPSSSRISKIFDHALPLIELESSYQYSTDWQAWAGIGYVFGEGKSLGCSNTTSISLVPFTLGIRRQFQITDYLDGRIGLGGLWTLYRNRDHSSDVHQRFSSNASGALITGALQWRLDRGFSLNLFAEYMFQRFNFSKVYSEHLTYRHDVNMNGTKLGVGIAYDF